MTVDERFDAKWRLDPETGCHIWQASKRNNGYGQFYDGTTTTTARRYAYERVHGPLAPGIHLRRRVPEACPRACVNPAHLVAEDLRGTTDHWKAQRTKRGKSHPSKRTSLPPGCYVTPGGKYCLKMCVKELGGQWHVKNFDTIQDAELCCLRINILLQRVEKKRKERMEIEK